MLREAGGWLRMQVLDAVASRALAWMLAMGLALAAALDRVLPVPLWTAAVPMAIGCALFPWTLSSNRAQQEWRLDHMRRGAAAERRTGQVLAWALIRPGCAIAHNASVPGTVGDIDHLVATGDTIHVVETKAEKVPKKHFPRVLRNLARNVRAVRAWAPSGTTVRGVLAIASDRGLKKEPKEYAEDGVTITVYGKFATERDLARSLRAVSTASAPVSPDLARRVWEAGSGEGPAFGRQPAAWRVVVRCTLLVVAVAGTAAVL